MVVFLRAWGRARLNRRGARCACRGLVGHSRREWTSFLNRPRRDRPPKRWRWDWPNRVPYPKAKARPNSG